MLYYPIKKSNEVPYFRTSPNEVPIFECYA